MSSPLSRRTHNNGKSLIVENTDFTLIVENIFKSFPSQDGKGFLLLEDISLRLSPGKIIAIVGKSGCGKTTLLNIIAGFTKPDSGKVLVNGSMGYVPQKDLLLPWRNILENVLLPIEIKRNYNTEIVKLARDLLERNGLSEFAEYYPQKISGGMRQKASLIRTLVQNPAMVLCDEPFSAIDFDARLRLVREFRSFILSSQKSAIFVTHNIEEAISISDEVITLGSKPTKVLSAVSVVISEKDRDPIAIRKTDVFDDLFGNIWQIISE